jgi:hypothetical protein
MIIVIDYYVTIDEIKHALRHAKSSVPGTDGIQYEDIGKMHDEGLEEFATIYNTSITNAAVNEEWLHSYLVPLPKPGKDHTKIQGYRISTMQNTVGKLLKKFFFF